MKLIVSEDADSDIRAAMTWYAAQRPGLEKEFLVALNEVLAFLMHGSGGAQRITKSLRSFPMERFPYSIIHAKDKKELIVLRVFHQRRNPRIRLRRKR